MLTLFLATLLIIAIALMFFCVRVLLLRGGTFSSFHIHDSEPMRQRGIHCVIDQDAEMRTPSPHAVAERNRQ